MTNPQQMSAFANAIFKQKYSRNNEEWSDTSRRVVTEVVSGLPNQLPQETVDRIIKLVEERKFIPGGRYLYSAGRPLHQTNNCFLVRAEDSREGWGELLKKAAMVLQTGGGLGVEYSDIRPAGSPISKTGGVASGPVALMQMVNEVGRGVMQGGHRRAALIALLDWDHDDALDFIHLKDWPEEIKKLKEDDYSFPATMDMTNISINLNDEFFIAYHDENHPKHNLARTVYWESLHNMITTGEPGFSVNVGEHADEKLRNPCGEITSADDSDVCCLGSLNLAAFDSIDQFREAIPLALTFLLAGTEYSHLPYEYIREIRNKNRRLGLGLMGIHDWLLQRGYKYGPNSELGDWLEEWAKSTDIAGEIADSQGISRPVKTRAIAPTGTISIIGETTQGIEPIFCVAYKRRYLGEGQVWKHQYVIDPTARKAVEQYGYRPDQIEDAYTLSYNVERRIDLQSFVQQYTDHAVSSTINLPCAIEDEDEAKEFGEMLIGHLPNLRGITAYPDGCRGGQPLTAVDYDYALDKEGLVFESQEDTACKSGVCGV